MQPLWRTYNRLKGFIKSDPIVIAKVINKAMQEILKQGMLGAYSKIGIFLRKIMQIRTIYTFY